MNRVFASPSRYVQGKGALKSGIDYIKALTKRPLLLCDDTVWEIVGESFHHFLNDQGLEVEHVAFNGEASVNEIDRVSEVVTEKACDAVIGLGGGKTIDSAKAIGDNSNIAVIVVPTLASSDAPTSALSVIYSDEGVFEGYRFYDKNPDLVLVDSSVVVQAPARLFAAGIGDAMATCVEGLSVIKAQGKTMAGGKASLAGQAIAEKCQETLFEYGELALAAVKEQRVTPAVEAVIEANTLLSGLGFESCGLAAAHAIHNGFTALSGDIHHMQHGEKVVYGTLTQLFLEKADKAIIDRFIHFYQAVGLPTTLAELKLDQTSYEDLVKVGELALQDGETIHEMVGDFSPEDIADALLAVDAYVNSLK